MDGAPLLRIETSTHPEPPSAALLLGNAVGKRLAPRISMMASSDGLEGRIHLIRGQRVMLDSDLAQLYGVATKRLNEQVRRNSRRFPGDFAFQLSLEEADILKSQFATSSWGGRRKLPMAFTEHGAVMLANVLNSKTAVEASVLVVRAFIRLRSILGSHAELARKVQELESRYDAQFRVVFDAIRELMEETEPQDKIGFRPT